MERGKRIKKDGKESKEMKEWLRIKKQEGV